MAGTLSAPAAALDPVVLRIWDVSNRIAPWAWFPFGQPREDGLLPPYAAGLYDVHGLPAVPMLAGRSRRVRLAGGAALVAGWVLFPGAWDRRAAHLRD